MIHPRLSLLAAAGVLAFAMAGPGARAQGTAAQRVACTGDAFSFCSADIPNVPRITACLRRNRSNISTACQQAMSVVAEDARHERAAP